MTRSRQPRLNLLALDDRAVPSIGTFVEDFNRDAAPAFAGFDSARDGVQIARYHEGTSGASFVRTPAGGPVGRHSLRLAPAPGVPNPQYLGGVFYTSQSGGLAPWEIVTAASVTVRGPGTITFTGLNEVTFTNLAPADEWVTFQVTRVSVNEYGEVLGPISSFRVAATGEMLVDDVTVTVELDQSQLQSEPSVVRVHRFGNGLGVTGDDRANLVRVEVVGDVAGTVRVSGLNGTRIEARTPNVTQVSPTEVLVLDFARSDERAYPEDRDLLISLHGGDDLLTVVGTDPTTPRETVIDDLFVNTGGGDSLVEFQDLRIEDSLSYRSGGGVDRLTAHGRMQVRAVDMNTGGGDDEVRIGRPGAAVFDGERVDTNYFGLIYDPASGVRVRRNRVETGAGKDTVVLADGVFADTRYVLGSGDDTFTVESANGAGLRVSLGSGTDVVTVREASASLYLVPQDAGDILRLHRVIGSHGQIEGSRRMNVELPASGTAYRQFDNDDILSWTPDLAPDALRELVLAYFDQESWDNVATIRFAPFDF